MRAQRENYKVVKNIYTMHPEEHKIQRSVQDHKLKCKSFLHRIELQLFTNYVRKKKCTFFSIQYPSELKKNKRKLDKQAFYR